jgi:hypothetical protein
MVVRVRIVGERRLIGGACAGFASRSLPGSVAGVNNANDYRPGLWVTSQSPQIIQSVN